MEKFWQLLRRINVRLVAIVVLIVLLCLIVWRLWVGHLTSWHTVEPPSLDTTGNGTNNIEESFFSWSRELKVPGQIKRNPFSSPALDEFLIQEEQARLAAEKAAAERAAAERAAAEEAAAARAAADLVAKRAAEIEAARIKAPANQPTPVAPPPPATRDVVLVYRGIMIRPDRTTLGLVENRTDNVTAFHRMGGKLAGLTIDGILRNELVLSSDNGTKKTMNVNEPMTFKETISDAR